MPSLADQRRAIGERNEAARRGLGEANAKARRAIGDEMIKRRTGKTEVDEINALVNQPRQRRALPTVEPRGSVPAQVGTGNYTAPPASGGGGIASPLVEPTASTREYYDPVLLPTTDGLAWVRWRSVKKFVMRDANDDEVILEFANGVS
ncbi:hypothetical protein QM298_13995 [Pseudomonas mendocina]|nr:hypothetical protein [Pseudomonas mendocina]MDV5861990.1 hypothetical protein [Pseudomonas mendocina]